MNMYIILILKLLIKPSLMRYDEQETFICFSPCANLLFGSVGEGNQRVLKLCGMQLYICLAETELFTKKKGK